MKDSMSQIHLDLLDKNRLEIFRKLTVFKKYGYLSGGTSLALQINHRKSYDFDVFVNNEISNFLKLEINKVFGDQKYLVNTSDQITFSLENSEVTFLWYYFKPIQALINTDYLDLSSIDDISADKAMTMGRRAVWRDYVDLFFLTNNNFLTLDQIVSNAQRKFGNQFVVEQFLEQLVYFKDLNVVQVEWVGKSYEENEIKSYLQNIVNQYISSKIK